MKIESQRVIKQFISYFLLIRYWYYLYHIVTDKILSLLSHEKTLNSQIFQLILTDYFTKFLVERAIFVIWINLGTWKSGTWKSGTWALYFLVTFFDKNLKIRVCGPCVRDEAKNHSKIEKFSFLRARSPAEIIAQEKTRFKNVTQEKIYFSICSI